MQFTTNNGHELTMDYTPWGRPQHIHSPIDGVYAIETASHGGLYLATHRVEQVDKIVPILGAFPRYWTYDGGVEWWEEDCDFTIPVLVFRREFLDAGKMEPSVLLGAARLLQSLAKSGMTNERYFKYRQAWELLDGESIITELAGSV